ncbi:hypothetical protein [Flavobacterium subsaxonicum]|nr:hypothetical protein [Flavobacterium subsaxonicum]
MTFKEHFGIPNDTVVDFLDIPLEEDLTAFICPFLIANNRDIQLVNEIYAQITAFLQKLNRNFIVPNNRIGGLEFLSHLHEPNEYRLGYSGRNKGSGIADLKAEIIFVSLRNNRFAQQGVTITNEAHNVLLLVKGIGQDIMSDTIANVSRDILAEFTEQQCIQYGVQTYNTAIEYYDPLTSLWSTRNYDLPYYNGKVIILLPKKIASGNRQYTNHYNYFLAGNHIAKDILNDKVDIPDGKFIAELKDGTKKIIVKQIYRTFRKPKNKLIDFVVNYQGSLLEFLDYAKTHYPELDMSSIIE